MVFHHHINDDEEKANSNGPVTVNVKIKAKKGRIDEFEEWLDNIIHESLKFEGHMGVSIIRPPDLANPEYIVIIRFDNYQNLAKWENSGIQRKWIEKGKDVIEDEPKVAKQTGLEFWFTPIFGNTAPALEAATVQDGDCYWCRYLCDSKHIASANTECNCGSSRLVRSPDIGCHNDSPYDLCDNANYYLATQTLVVKKEIILM